MTAIAVSRGVWGPRRWRGSLRSAHGHRPRSLHTTSSTIEFKQPPPTHQPEHTQPTRHSSTREYHWLSIVPEIKIPQNALGGFFHPPKPTRPCNSLSLMVQFDGGRNDRDLIIAQADHGVNRTARPKPKRCQDEPDPRAARSTPC